MKNTYYMLIVVSKLTIQMHTFHYKIESTTTTHSVCGLKSHYTCVYIICVYIYIYYHRVYLIESVDSISKDERGFPLTQYITNGRISRGGYTFTHFKHHHRVLRLISYRMGV